MESARGFGDLAGARWTIRKLTQGRSQPTIIGLDRAMNRLTPVALGRIIRLMTTARRVTDRLKVTNVGLRALARALLGWMLTVIAVLR
jgi:hypothetical protein